METTEKVGTTEAQISKKKNFKKGDILEYNRYVKGDMPSHFFKCTSVDEGWGVVGYCYGGINNTIGIAYVNKTNFFQKILYYLSLL